MLNEEFAIELKTRQMEYLKEMMQKYSLDDPSKAVRCLINFAMTETEHEVSIFEEIRCLDC